MLDTVKGWLDFSDSPKFRNFARSALFAGLIPMTGYLITPDAWVVLVGEVYAGTAAFIAGNILRAYMPNVLGPEK